MTREEWIARCAKRFEEKGNLMPQEAREAAIAVFDDEMGDIDFAFSELEAYNPEDVADNEMERLAADHAEYGEEP